MTRDAAVAPVAPTRYGGQALRRMDQRAKRHRAAERKRAQLDADNATAWAARSRANSTKEPQTLMKFVVSGKKKGVLQHNVIPQD